MPSPTRRSKSRSPNNGTRRRRLSNFAWPADPLFDAMVRGELKWGDLLMEQDPKYVYKSRSPASRSPPMPRAPPGSPVTPPYSPINDAFEDFVTPDLRLRKFIWEKFPVVLEEIRTRNGREMFAVKWHRRNLEEWRSSRTSSYEEAMEYELFSELRLIHSLRKHPHLYALHEPRSKDEIVVIEMLGAARAPAPASAAPAARGRAASPARGAAAAAAAGPRVPELRKLNDITTHFPGVVVWEKVEGRKGESTYALKIRNDFGKKMAPKLKERILGDLEAALRASRFWAVLAPKSGEFLRLEMRHD